MESNDNSRSEAQASRDYLAIGVFLCALAAFFVTGYFSLKVVTGEGGLSRLMSAPEAVKDIQGYGERLISKLIRGREAPTRGGSDAAAHIRRGHRHYRNKNFQEALGEYDKAVKAEPDNAEALYWRGRTKLNTGQFDPAAEDFKTAVKLKPDYPEAYDNLGWLSARRGDYAEGIAFLTKSLELRPENGWALYNRGHMFLKRGEMENALKDFEMSCKLGFREACKAYEDYKDRAGGKG